MILILIVRQYMIIKLILFILKLIKEELLKKYDKIGEKIIKYKKENIIEIDNSEKDIIFEEFK